MNDIVFIPSTINTGTVGWTYSSIRSVYSPEERFQQTLYTIESIRTYFPGAKVLLVESSKLSEQMTRTLLEKADYYLNLYDYDYVRKACFESNMKGYGEAVQNKFAIEYIIQHNIQFNRFFKLSGRYFLTEKFQSKNFSVKNFTFKKRIDTHDGSLVISTVLYSVPNSLFEHYYTCIRHTIRFYETRGAKSFEELLPVLCEPRDEIETVGAGGRIAVAQDELIFV